MNTATETKKENLDPQATRQAPELVAGENHLTPHTPTAKERFIDPAVEASRAAKERAIEASRVAKQRVQQAAGRSRDWATDELDHCVEYARQKPLTTSALVGALGLLIGLAVGTRIGKSLRSDPFFNFGR